MDHQQYRLRLKSQPELIKEFYAILSAEKIELPEKAKAILSELDERISGVFENEPLPISNPATKSIIIEPNSKIIPNI